jgi:hypothetical protein
VIKLLRRLHDEGPGLWISVPDTGASSEEQAGLRLITYISDQYRHRPHACL